MHPSRVLSLDDHENIPALALEKHLCGWFAEILFVSAR
jgi:hypothetical protein